MNTAKKKNEGFKIQIREGARGKSFSVRIWDQTAKAYMKSKSFPARKLKDAREAERAAIRWGRDEAQKVQRGLVKASSGTGVNTEQAFNMYLEAVSKLTQVR
jgi:hypothetical protein